jgi:nucleotide-binding universal stress UspA family protein
MKTLLIPVDLTATAENAVNFGAEWCKRYDYTRIILLKTFYDNVFDQIVLSAEYAVNQDYRQQERQQVLEYLDTLRNRIAATAGEGVTIITVVSEVPLLRAILDVIRDEKADTLLVGSDNYSYSSGSIVAGNVVSIAKVSPIKVLVVPAGYTYRPVTTALVPVNFDALDPVSRFSHVHTSPTWGNTRLLVLNVDPEETYLHPDQAFREKEENLHLYLQHFEHELHYSNDTDILNGVRQFIQEHPVQLVIALPGKHSFLYSLTHKSISEAIYRNAQEPVLILK